MIRQTPGKIYLADQRGVVETAQHRRYCTFNFGEYVREHKEAFGLLRAVNEETLAGGATLPLAANRAAHLLVLPITGKVQVAANGAPTETIDVGEVYLLTVPAGATLRLANPYPTDAISFLHLWLETETPLKPAFNQRFAFDSGAIQNQLAELVPTTATQSFALRLGRFAARHEAEVRLQRAAHIFVFVLAGAFEVEGRLLHEKDGLALWDTDAVELEALSNDALVLVVTW